MPVPVDCNRHCLVMEYVKGSPLCASSSTSLIFNLRHLLNLISVHRSQVREMAVPFAERYLQEAQELVVRLAENGLIHGDFNEFNLMLKEEGASCMVNEQGDEEEDDDGDEFDDFVMPEEGESEEDEEEDDDGDEVEEESGDRGASASTSTSAVDGGDDEDGDSEEKEDVRKDMLLDEVIANRILKADKNYQLVVIDFPQMISTDHLNASELRIASVSLLSSRQFSLATILSCRRQFDRDIDCLHTFFHRRFGVQSDFRPKLQDIRCSYNMDCELEASGFTAQKRKEFQMVCCL